MSKYAEVPTAFPWTHEDVTCTGMTLRDYMAAKAMHALLVNQPPHATDMTFLEWADDAYQMADAMLEAREAAA